MPGLGLTQAKPGPEPEPPKPWTDPVTGEAARNPFKQPKDFKSIALLERLNPLLAEHLKTMAEGVSYAKLAEVEEAKAKREMLRRLEYRHEANPWVTGDLATQSQFVQQHDAAIVAFYKQEAQPVELNFDNLTLKGQLAQHNPPLRELWQRAHEIYASWLAEDRARLEQERQAVEQKLQAHRSKQGALA